jgi:bla regulator protein BlaR1
MTRELLPFVDHLWQSTVVGLLAWLVCATVLASTRARVRFGVWLAASLKFLIPFAILVEAGQHVTMGAPVTQAQSQQIFDAIVTAGTPVMAPAQIGVSPTPQAPTDHQQLIAVLVIGLWSVGASAVLWRWLVQWREIHALARTAQPAGRYRNVTLLRSERMRDRGIEPGVVGLWRHAIVLPSGIDEQLTPPQLEAVLEHERQHAERQDNLLALLHTIVQTIFWFHPLVWLIGRRLTAERETACDEAVLESARAEDYAEGILTVCKFYWNPLRRHASGITSADLKARMEAILKNQLRPQPGLVLRSLLAFTLVFIVATPLLVGWLTAQAVAPEANSFLGLATSADKRFEVASIKVNDSGSEDFRLGPPMHGSITIINLPLAGIIAQSFRTNRSMMTGDPAWAGSTRYDILAKGPDSNVANPVVWEMMRSLLIDRFHLKYHVDQRETPIYALTIAPGGHKLTLGEKGHCAQALKEGHNCGDIMLPPFGAAMDNMPIGALLQSIGRRAGRPIVDRTGLTGRYDANITWLPEGTKIADVDLTNVPKEYQPQDMTLFEALEKQAGLKLVPDRAPMPVLVVDSVSRPDPN